MPAVPHKAKQYLFALSKVLVLAAAFYFIYHKLYADKTLDWPQFILQFQNWGWPFITLLLLLSISNRLLEIIKWQNLVSAVSSISLAQASQQVIGAMTAGIFTPNGFGEYGAKTLFFEKALAKEILFLNLLCNGVQLFWSSFFGVLGLLYFNACTHIFPINIVISCFLLLAAVIIIPLAIKKFSIKGFSIQKLLSKTKALPNEIRLKNLVLGLARYLIFSHQYFLLFRMCGIELPYLLIMSSITSIYLISSSIPTFQFMDVAVKGSIAVYFFGLLGVNQWIVIFISTLMWLLNVAIPVIIGSYYVLKFKSPWSQ